MDNKVILILFDGVRSDALDNCTRSLYLRMRKDGAWTMNATTVVPPITTPAHMSLFYSVEPARHGTFGLEYVKPERPLNGLCEQLNAYGKSCAFFYNWEELRDLAHQGALVHSQYDSGIRLGFEKASELSTEAAIRYIPENLPDFVFLYLGIPDEAGHMYGWMSDAYMRAINRCWDMAEKVCSVLPEAYQVIFTTDHGGHGNVHGIDIPEDMIIPFMASGSCFLGKGELTGVSIKDIAPTIVSILGVPPDAEWEGKNLIS